MTSNTSPNSGLAVITSVMRWVMFIVPVSFVVGTSVALFLWLLDEATSIRVANPWLLWLLPVGGATIGFMYRRWGNTADKGTRLIIDEIHQPGGGIPARMAPFVLIGTIVTHLFGGSAGREGTAVQMGGALASAFEVHILRRFKFGVEQMRHIERQELLQAGIASGFGAVFGTPLTGAVFAIEVLTVRRFGLLAVLPCLLSAYVGHFTVAFWGVHHTSYPHIVLSQLGLPPLDAWTLGKVTAASIVFGLAALLFLTCAHGVSAVLKRFVAVPWMRPVVGGIVVIALTFAVGSTDYLGLGVTAPPGYVSIVSSFDEGGANSFSWLLKTIFTTVTVGSGFKGGEVTPLFFIGSTLGNALAHALNGPIPLFAALGFVAVFGAAANTPIACTIMGIELFGFDSVFYIALACMLAFLSSGRRSIYSSHGADPAIPPPEAENPPQPNG